jgi:hypothetical protein
LSGAPRVTSAVGLRRSLRECFLKPFLYTDDEDFAESHEKTFFTAKSAKKTTLAPRCGCSAGEKFFKILKNLAANL